ncbi:MAG TPA: TraR/DksA C4-type zinc finger protein [Jatrophihabitans sp.]
MVSTDPAAVLATERAATQARIASLQGDVDTIVGSASSTTGDDEHDPEGATIGFERAQALALLAQARHHLTEIDAALARHADGSYGTCVVCGRPIAPERLAARPTAMHCVHCAGRHS